MTVEEAMDVLTQCAFLEDSIMRLKAQALGVIEKEAEEIALRAKPQLELVSG